MGKIYRLDGQLVEVTDEELLEAVKADDRDYPSDLLSDIVRSGLMSAYVFGKTRFDTAKDTSQMLAAASETEKALTDLLEYKMHIRLEELVQERLAPKPQQGDE